MKEPIALSVTYTFDLRCFMNTGPDGTQKQKLMYIDTGDQNIVSKDNYHYMLQNEDDLHTW